MATPPKISGGSGGTITAVRTNGGSGGSGGMWFTSGSTSGTHVTVRAKVKLCVWCGEPFKKGNYTHIHGSYCTHCHGPEGGKLWLN